MMSKITKYDVLHVAKLSNLNLTDEEVDKFTPQLTKIVHFISELSKVDTTHTKPTNQTTGLTNVLRQDEVRPESILTQEEAISGSDTYNGLFKVTAILTERTDK